MKKQKTKLRHRVLALALALMLCVGMLPMAAFAEYVPPTRFCNFCHEEVTCNLQSNQSAKNCQDKPNQAWECPQCHHILANTNYGEPGPHSWGEWQITEQPTCTTGGSRQRTCSVCNRVETESLSAMPHELMYCHGKAATCFETGTAESWVCNRPVNGTICGAQFLDSAATIPVSGKDDLTIPKLNADYTGQKFEPAGSGQHKKVCKNCNGGAEGHFVLEDCKDTDGDGKCDDCGDSVECNHIGGNHEDLSQHKDATCTEKGQEVYVCNTCGGVVDNKEISPLGHDLQYCPGTPATCTEKGWKESWVCNRTVNGEICGAQFFDENGNTPVNSKDDLTIPELEPVFEVEGSRWIEQDGVKHMRHCVNCNGAGEGHTEFGAHRMVETYTKPATCTEGGYTERKCLDCGYSEFEKTSPLGHELETISKENTCTEAGLTGEKCTRPGCDYRREVSVDPLGHDYKIVEQIPGDSINHQLICGNDASHTTTEAHTYSDWSGWSEWVDNGDGTHTHTHTRSCEACGYTESESVSEPISTNPSIPTIPTNPTEPIEPTEPTNPSTPDPDEDIEDPDVPLGPNPGEPTPDPDEEIEDPDVPLGPNPGEPTPTPDPDEEIEDPDVPLAPGPVDPDAEPTPAPTTKPAPAPDKDEEISDEKVPLAKTPKTGDDTGVWMTLALASAAGLVLLGLSRKRKGQNVR